MFIWTGGSAMSAVVRRLTGLGAGVEQIMMTALLLNIALILFGWRRYRDLQIEVQQRKEAEERASLLAATDPLTGFLNRRSIAEAGIAFLERAASKHKSVALLDRKSVVSGKSVSVRVDLGVGIIIKKKTI